MSGLVTTVLRVLFMLVVLSGFAIGGYMMYRLNRELFGMEVSEE